MQEILALSSIPLCQCLLKSTMFLNLPFIIFASFPAQRKYLSTQTTEIPIHAFVTSKLDHCNSLIYNVPKNFIKKLQSVHNAAVRLISVITSLQYSSIFTGYLFLNELNSRFYYLPSRLHQQSQTYIQDLITRYLPSRSLRSPSTLSLNPVSFNLKTYGSRAFSVSAPKLWNKLPNDIHSCENLSLFKHKLKTYLFKNYYFSHQEDFFFFFFNLTICAVVIFRVNVSCMLTY